MGAPVFARRARAYLGLMSRAKPILAFPCGETDFSREKLKPNCLSPRTYGLKPVSFRNKTFSAAFDVVP